MLTITRDHAVYAMDEKNPPAAKVQPGELVVFETEDCFGGQLTDESQKMGDIDWAAINPATGPLYVEGAMPGDQLKVEILSIEIADRGVMADAPGEGVTGAALTDEATRLLPVENGRLTLSGFWSVPVRPMIGVIGTAPAGEAVPTGTPGAHGGNMDCNQIGAGTVLYLPVYVPGALLAMGDLHAVMGDGEVAVCGAEIAGRVTVRIQVIKWSPLPTPFLLTPEKAIAIASAPTLDQAANDAVMAMHQLLSDTAGLDEHTAGSLLSLVGDVRICQMVDPAKTCRMEFPRRYFEQVGFRFP